MTRRALLIQDHEGLSHALRMVLEGLAFDVVDADLGAEGVSCARSERFDLYVVDDCLPDLSGFEILRAVRAAGDRAPAIFVSTYANDRDVASGALASGADALLLVPFTLKHCVETIDAVLRETRGFGPLRRAWEPA